MRDKFTLRVVEASDLCMTKKRKQPSTYIKAKPLYGGKSRKTKIVPNARRPVFNAEFLLPVPTDSPADSQAEKAVEISVISKSVFSREVLGSFTVKLDSRKDFDGWIILHSEPRRKVGEPGKVHIKLVFPSASKTSQSSVIDQYYTMGKEIGRGAFSVVYKGKSKTTGEEVAIKKIRKAGQTTEQVKLLQREIDVMSKLRHPNIVSLENSYEDDESIFLILEFIPFGELYDQIVARGSFTEADANHLVRQMVDAVTYMHDNGIAHRDLKPENLLCPTEKGDTIKIADFGLSKDFAGSSIMQTCCGSPSYVAPEVLDGTAYDVRCDIWSIGVITYVLLSGYLPFYGETQEELFQHIMSGTFSFSYASWKTVSPEAKDFISQCLTKSPDRRPRAKDLQNHAWLTVSSPPNTPLETIKSMQSQRSIQVLK